MTIENEDGVLNSTDGPATIEDIIADVTSRLEAGDDVLDEDEDGPSDEGELPDDDLDTTDYDEDQEDDEESDEEEETSEDDDDSDADDPGKPEGDEPKAEAKADPRDEEIANLKGLVLQTQQQAQQLIDFVLRQQERSVQAAQPKSVDDDLSEEVIHAMLFGGTEEDVKSLDPQTRVKAQRFAQNWTREQARYAKDPSAFYREKIQDLVRNEIRSAVGPVLQKQTVQEAQVVLEKHLAGLDNEAKKRVAEVFQTLNSPTEEALKFAADFVRKEQKEALLAERERKVETSERQRVANRKAARRGVRPGRRAPKTDNNPRMKPGETPEQFYMRLMNKE